MVRCSNQLIEDWMIHRWTSIALTLVISCITSKKFFSWALMLVISKRSTNVLLSPRSTSWTSSSTAKKQDVARWIEDTRLILFVALLRDDQFEVMYSPICLYKLSTTSLSSCVTPTLLVWSSFWVVSSAEATRWNTEHSRRVVLKKFWRASSYVTWIGSIVSFSKATASFKTSTSLRKRE